jgi:hypothetical protein
LIDAPILARDAAPGRIGETMGRVGPGFE